MKVNVNNVSLKISAGLPSQFVRTPLPQIAFSGRSNVGKSSLINTLLNRKSMARVSSAPGKTITVNFYDVDKKLFLVDLPGYGYAKRSMDSKRSWSSLTEDYFLKNPSLFQAFFSFFITFFHQFYKKSLRIFGDFAKGRNINLEASVVGVRPKYEYASVGQFRQR